MNVFDIMKRDGWDIKFRSTALETRDLSIK